MNIKLWFLGLLGDLGKFLKVLFKDALQKQLKLIMPIAMDAVKQVASDPSILSSNEKRDMAIGIIKDKILDGQREIGLSVIALAVEVAVQNIKNPD